MSSRHVIAQLAQLRAGADDVHVAAFADPDRQRRAPVALAGQAPVDDVVQEVAEAALLDVVRQPVDGAVVGHQLIVHRRHADEPRGAGVVDQRRVAAPAEGIVMGEVAARPPACPRPPAASRIIGSAFLTKTPAHGVPSAISPLGVHQLQEGNVVLAADAGVVLAEGGRLMHHAGTVGHGDVVVGHHRPGVGGVGIALERLGLEVEQRLIVACPPARCRGRWSCW